MIAKCNEGTEGHNEDDSWEYDDSKGNNNDTINNKLNIDRNNWNGIIAIDK